jgi:hypothetical protein
MCPATEWQASARGAAPPLAGDTHAAQAVRAADFMELHPDGSTVAEIGAAADLGSPTKVLSSMRKLLGCAFQRSWTPVSG